MSSRMKNLLLVGGVILLFAPLFVFGQENTWALKQKQAIDILDIVRKVPLSKAQSDLFYESIYWPDSDNAVKTGAIVLTKQIILQEELDYWFVKAPYELSKKFIKAIYKLLPLVAYGDFSGAIDLIEKFTVEQANQYIDNWLKQNQVQIGSGIGKYAFISFKNNPQAINIPYIIVYSPISQNKTKIVIEFYSKTAIEPPIGTGINNLVSDQDNPKTSCWPWDIWIQNPKNKTGLIKPFIVRVKGQVVKDQFGNFAWDKTVSQPTVEVEFGKPVPEIDQSDIILQSLGSQANQGFLQKKINQIKQTAQGIINQIKTFLAVFKPQAQIASFVAPSISSGVNRGLPSVDLTEGSPLLVQGAKDSLTDLIDQFDDISEQSEILFSQAERLINEKNARQIEESTEKMKLAVEQVIKEKQEDLVFEQGTTSTPLEASLLTGCSQATGQESAFDKVIFNEIAWMGSKNSSADEWIELKNIFIKPVDLYGWQIFNKSQGIKIIFSTSSVVAPGGFWLLERTNDNSAPTAKADLIYTGAIANTDEALYLVGPNCILQDKAKASPDWQGGDNSTKQTMERTQFFGWQTSSIAGGTPKAQNGAGKINLPNINSGAGVTAYSPARPPNPESLPNLLISEIQIDSENGASDEFIELYNPNNFDVSLKWWSVQKAASSGAVSKKNFGTEDVIPTNGYFLIVNSFASQQLLGLADLAHNSFSISPDNTIFLMKSQDYVAPGNETAVSDKVGWGESFSPEQAPAPAPSSNQTIGRKWLSATQEYQDTNNNQDDFEIQTPTPKQKNQALPENQPPVALFSFGTEKPEVGQEVVFNAASSTDSDGFIVSYTWDFGDGAFTDSEKSTISHSFSSSSQFQISLFVKDNKTATSSPATRTITVLPKPKILISEIQVESTDNKKQEFIELYNPNNTDLDLTSWYLQRKTKSASDFSSLVPESLLFGKTIKAKDYFLIANASSSFLADVFKIEFFC